MMAQILHEDWEILFCPLEQWWLCGARRSRPDSSTIITLHLCDTFGSNFLLTMQEWILQARKTMFRTCHVDFQMFQTILVTK